MSIKRANGAGENAGAIRGSTNGGRQISPAW
ncbi:hypothetical protein AB7M56_001994 [Bradyrhizobium elkanii]|nr:hypothetical protein [Bradyrhizobium elkanii]MCS3524088.1 hypothetical protein [Bradyrhizobium elkanii]MCS4071744.1 hypothetical protein [Bradyrhizobium elkanii]MCS4078376.1 hypothetical protein [Bradyrhizobium elkanii]MCS4110703.1 hypothetical protein [Bradyrhizobium elkanii]